MRERSDEDLMKAWANGSMEAFETLYSRYRAPLYRYLLRLAGDEATANDLYQGAWEKVIAARRNLPKGAPFRAWLFRIAHNHAVDRFRRRRPETGLESETLATSSPGPAEEVSIAEQQQSLESAVQALPADQRDALLLKLEGGLDLDEISRVTGVGRETVKSRLRYAVKKLRRTLAPDSTEMNHEH